jgi:hypothetical protein
MTTNEHQIDRLHLLLKAKSRRIAVQRQQDFSYLLQTPGFLQQLEAILNRLTPNGEYIELASLHVCFECADQAKMQALFLAELEKVITHNIRRTQDQTILQLSNPAFTLKVLRDFLLYGTALHPGAGQIMNDVLSRIRTLAIKEDPEVEGVIIDTVIISAAAVQRLQLLIGEELIRQIFRRLFDLPKGFFAILEDTSFSLPDYLLPLKGLPLETPAFWQTAFRIMKTLIGSPLLLKERSADMTSDPVLSLTSERIQVLPKIFEDIPQTLQNGIAIPVENAGLVLLWTVFRKLFTDCGYVREPEFADQEKQQQAILLMQYLVTGKLIHEEYELPLNKLLCSWPLHQPINLSLLPGEDALRAADKAFDAFIVSWRGDKKYSAAWFRMAYLQRSGELKFRNDGNLQLVVDRKTEDILLSPMTVIRLPWMTNLIFIQW